MFISGLLGADGGSHVKSHVGSGELGVTSNTGDINIRSWVVVNPAMAVWSGKEETGRMAPLDLLECVCPQT